MNADRHSINPLRSISADSPCICSIVAFTSIICPEILCIEHRLIPFIPLLSERKALCCDKAGNKSISNEKGDEVQSITC
ncbi:MAG: hypothetical protein R6U96_08015 [Promethearchaeia archaeon]